MSLFNSLSDTLGASKSLQSSGAHAYQWGVTHASTTLSNQIIGTEYDQCIYHAWQAARDGFVSSYKVMLQWSDRPGYHQGTGGVIRIQLFKGRDFLNPDKLISYADVQSDIPGPWENNWPENTLLDRLQANGRRRSDLHPRFLLSSVVPIVKGEWYFTKLSNIDPNKHINYLSVNAALSGEANELPIAGWAGGSIADGDETGRTYESYLSVAHDPASELVLRPKDSHVSYEIFMDDGASFGHAYVDFKTDNPGGNVISGTQMKRQAVVVPVDNVVKNVSLKVGRHYGSDPLILKIVDESGQVLRESGVASTAIHPQHSEPDKFDGIIHDGLSADSWVYGHTWVDFTFDELILKAQRRVFCEFSTGPATVYYSVTQQIGSGLPIWGYGMSTAGLRGEIAQMSVDGGESWISGYLQSNGDYRDVDPELPVCINRGCPRSLY